MFRDLLKLISRNHILDECAWLILWLGRLSAPLVGDLSYRRTRLSISVDGLFYGWVGSWLLVGELSYRGTRLSISVDGLFYGWVGSRLLVSDLSYRGTILSISVDGLFYLWDQILHGHYGHYDIHSNPHSS
jgi:hypothetical protein